MSVKIVDSLQTIDITDHHGKRPLVSLFDFRIDFLFKFRIGMFVFYPGQGVDGCHSSGNRKTPRIFLLPPNLCVFIKQSDNQKRLFIFGDLCRLQSHISRQLSAHQTIIKHKYTVSFNGFENILLCNLCVEQCLVFRMDRLETVFIGCTKEIDSLTGNAKFFIFS